MRRDSCWGGYLQPTYEEKFMLGRLIIANLRGKECHVGEIIYSQQMRRDLCREGYLLPTYKGKKFMLGRLNSSWGGYLQPTY